MLSTKSTKTEDWPSTGTECQLYVSWNVPPGDALRDSGVLCMIVVPLLMLTGGPMVKTVLVVVGDPAYDATQHLLNCRTTSRLHPDRTIQRFADLAGIEHERVRLWTFARALRNRATIGSMTILCHWREPSLHKTDKCGAVLQRL